MNPNIVTAVQTLIVQCFLIGYVFLLLVFRTPKRMWQRRWFVSIGAILLLNLLLIAGHGTKLYNQLGVLTLLLPYNLVTLWCSQYRDARTLFAAANSTYVSSIAILSLYVVQYLCPGNGVLPFAAQILTLIVMFFVLKRFAYAGRKMMVLLHKGWVWLWLLPMGASMASMYVYNQFFHLAPVPTFAAQYAILLVCGGAYYVMYLFFEQVQNETEAVHNQKMLAIQVSGLQSRIEAAQTAEEQIRIQRHDMRHQIQTVRQLIAEQKTNEALHFLGQTERRLTDTQTVKWCNAPILNAVFTAYFHQAEAESIAVETRLAFPNPLPVDEGELAMVFANALENAVHACTALPEQQRRIKCIAIASPSMMWEISNPCAQPVTFDEHGIPVSKQKGHGVGVQSIVSFCKKYHAAYQFEQKDDQFVLRIIL